ALVLGAERTAARREKIVERPIAERPNLAATPQPITHFALSARTGNRPSKVRITQRHVFANEAKVLADRARRLGLRLGHCCFTRKYQPTRPDARQRVTQGLHAQARKTSRSRNFVVRSRNSSCTWPVGPLRCLATMMSATPFLSVSGLYFSSR